ncbi:uncharacterized protein [Asterias amurensis]|uniref:uncharacterized protein n=1 Tax=Asterias amurensis TaxID=7602 RepID=UPI003AB568F3
MSGTTFPDHISKSFAPKLSELYKDDPSLGLISPPGSNNSKKVTFADFPEDRGEARQPLLTAGGTERSHRLEQLRNALGRHMLVERGISYMLPKDEDRISVENVFKPRLSAVFDRELPKKDATLFNHRPGETSPRDTPRLCQEISETRARNSSFLSPREDDVPTEFVMRSPRGLNQLTDPPSMDVVRLPSSSLPIRRLRRKTMTIGPRIKELLDSFNKYADVTEDMDGVPPTRDSYRKTRNRESVRIQSPRVIGDEQKRDIFSWLEKGSQSSKHK